MLNRVTIQGYLIKKPIKYQTKNDPTPRCILVVSHPLMPVEEKVYGVTFLKEKQDIWLVYCFGKTATYMLKNAKARDFITVDGAVYQTIRFGVTGEKKLYPYIKASVVQITKALTKQDAELLEKYRIENFLSANGKNKIEGGKK